jgi:hypothetical protein
VRTFLFHCSALLLVVAFVHTFILWREIGNAFGRDIRNGVPLSVAGVLAIAIAVFVGVNMRRGKFSVDWRWIAAAVIVAIVGLASTDPVFPAKRIHVPQYLILAVVLSFAIPRADRTSVTLWLVFLATVAYGVHDEFLQGLHPRRSFGVRDMFVNACGAGAGTFLVRALLPARSETGRADAAGSAQPKLVAALLLVVGGVAMFAIAATAYRADILPYWTVLPALAGGLVLAVVAERLPARGDRLAVRGLVGVCVLYAIYPLVINVAFLDFA